MNSSESGICLEQIQDFIVAATSLNNCQFRPLGIKGVLFFLGLTDVSDALVHLKNNKLAFHYKMECTKDEIQKMCCLMFIAIFKGSAASSFPISFYFGAVPELDTDEQLQAIPIARHHSGMN